MASRACGILLAQEAVDGLIAERRVEQNVELPVEARGQRGGEGEQAFDAAGDFGGAAIAVAHHAFDPGGLAARPRTMRAISSTRVRTFGASGREMSV